MLSIKSLVGWSTSTADALSRAPLPRPLTMEESLFDDEISAKTNLVVNKRGNRKRSGRD